MATSTENHVLGRGKLYFDRFATGTTNTSGEMYFGNTPELSFTFESETLDHYSSDAGVKTKDDSVILQVNRTGSFTCDHISMENLALFFLGSTTTIVVSAATPITGESIGVVKANRFYQLGVSATNPSGVRKVSAVTVKEGASVKVLGTHYNVDLELGRVEALVAGAAAWTVDYTIGASSREQAISGSTPIEGALRLISNNAAGENHDFFMPWVKLSPNGDLQLKGDDWRVIPFNVEVLKKGDLEAIYMDGRAYIA